jgi:hypothetical protein
MGGCPLSKPRPFFQAAVACAFTPLVFSVLISEFFMPGFVFGRTLLHASQCSWFCLGNLVYSI